MRLSIVNFYCIRPAPVILKSILSLFLCPPLAYLKNSTFAGMAGNFLCSLRCGGGGRDRSHWLIVFMISSEFMGNGFHDFDTLFSKMFNVGENWELFVVLSFNLIRDSCERLQLRISLSYFMYCFNSKPIILFTLKVIDFSFENFCCCHLLVLFNDEPNILFRCFSWAIACYLVRFQITLFMTGSFWVFLVFFVLIAVS